jgi:hypothetical protein
MITSRTRRASPTSVKPKTYPPLKAVKKPSFKSLILIYFPFSYASIISPLQHIKVVLVFV